MLVSLLPVSVARADEASGGALYVRNLGDQPVRIELTWPTSQWFVHYQPNGGSSLTDGTNMGWWVIWEKLGSWTVGPGESGYLTQDCKNVKCYFFYKISIDGGKTRRLGEVARWTGDRYLLGFEGRIEETSQRGASRSRPTTTAGSRASDPPRYGDLSNMSYSTRPTESQSTGELVLPREPSPAIVVEASSEIAPLPLVVTGKTGTGLDWASVSQTSTGLVVSAGLGEAVESGRVRLSMRLAEATEWEFVKDGGVVATPGPGEVVLQVGHRLAPACRLRLQLFDSSGRLISSLEGTLP